MDSSQGDMEQPSTLKCTYTLRPREHCILVLRSRREKVEPPDRDRNTRLLCSRPENTTVMALGKFTTFIIEVFYTSKKSHLDFNRNLSMKIGLTGSAQMVERSPVTTITQEDGWEEDCVEVHVILPHKLV